MITDIGWVSEWTKKNLEDPTDHLYFDNIALNKKIGRAKFAYNSGQMMQAAALLYQITKQKNYLEDAQNIAEACHKHFFTHFTSPNGQTFQLLKKGNICSAPICLEESPFIPGILPCIIKAFLEVG